MGTLWSENSRTRQATAPLLALLALAGPACMSRSLPWAAVTRYPLHAAVAANDLQRVKLLLAAGKRNPNERNESGYTPLHVAFLSFKVYWHPPSPEMAQMVQHLLAHGADPNIPFSYGGEPQYTPLHFAAFDGNMVLVPMLVAAGAAVNARDSRGFTPLHAAARCDFRLSCDDCTAAGSDFAARWKQGARPVLQYLLAHGGDLTLRTRTGQSVLDVFTTPCSRSPQLCAPERLATAQWPSGTCKESYIFVQAALAARARQ